MTEPVAIRDPEILGGTPVFFGTRVPVETVFDFLKGGKSIDAFVDAFPSVRREQVSALLKQATDSLLESVL
ncbi:MAG TPA: DUF433 domain-containing protein [Rhizomicrobium sp.]